MSLVGFKGQNHRQQTGKRGPLDRVDDRGTPPELFDPLMERFGFTLDVAAAEHNAKCASWYSLGGFDGLANPWFGRVWCNPPYSNLEPWLRKAWDAWTDDKPEVIVMLLPANRTEQGWWQDHIEPYRDRGAMFSIEFMRGRQRFIMPGQTEVLPNQRPPFGVCLAIWGAS